MSKRFPVIAQHIGVVIAFDKWCLSLMHSFSVTSANIATSHIVLKTIFFTLRFCCDSMGLAATSLA